MKLGISQLVFGKHVNINMDLIRQAENLGFHSAWTAEAYGNDAVSTAAWILAQTSRLHVGTAIMQMPARSPAMAAMTAMTLDHLSGGRFTLGLGPSGPQVAEGWHGQIYGKPLARTKEYIEIIRHILRREAPLQFQGELYQVPNMGEGSTGLGKPLKSILHGNGDLPIYTASISPNGLRCAAECADGVFPMMLDPDKYTEVIKPHLDHGFARAGDGKSKGDFVVAPGVTCAVGDYEQLVATVKPQLALYIGGMGAKNKNFYTDYASRLGFEEAAHKIQDLYLGGRQREAIEAVPDELVDAVYLIGPEEKIRERLKAWQAAGERGEVDLMLVAAHQPEALELLADAML
ncbi:MAG: F420-dependent oxidoreductase-like protein [Halieaceae bacterium]|jgi:F420-dependent oxidoreductase-like protein